MSAVFTGNGLGLFNTSLSQLGYGGGAGVSSGEPVVRYPDVRVPLQ